ncbi:DNA mismatch repair protein MutS [Peptoniphilus olsenii]|uniref:DNA mismatch repair protein MutS n=1 Tax=Peptoniphilus olsenii TaxID=411570 RepID=A0ABV2J9I9_9FIRM
MDRSKLTPMMKQYLSVKDKNPDAILFFRLGDFYEMFFDDALTASRELEITLTRRDAGLEEKAPMCGVPYHVASNYISKLINKGYKVAICDQVEDPKKAKGIVKREVTKIITPGTFTDDEYLKSDENNYLLSIFCKNYNVNLTYTDYSTGEIFVTSNTFLDNDDLEKFLYNEISRISPNEIIINNLNVLKMNKNLILNTFYTNVLDEEETNKFNLEDVKEHFGVDFINSYSNLLKERNETEFKSVNMILKYLFDTQKINLKHINKINYFNNEKYLMLDESSKRTLELVKGLNTFKKSGSLLEVLDECITAMGSRKLKKWVESPLNSVVEIENRLDLIEALSSNFLFQDLIIRLLKDVYDIERLLVKLSNNTINPREIFSLKKSIYSSIEIKKELQNSGNKFLKDFSKKILNLKDLYDKIDEMLIDNPPIVIEENRILKVGFSSKLDDFFEISEKGKNWIVDFESKERNRTGIKNLKIKYNKILGYFIEITKSNLDNVPDDYIRKQTLVGSERFFSVELKEMESKLLGSKERALDIQYQYYNELKEYITENINYIQILADVLSDLDSLISLSIVSSKNGYNRPKINTDGFIDIKNGRHPIVETKNLSEIFVPNDTKLDLENNMIHIITGPNMAGKSTYMRQVALIVIMAHIGCFVPCESANICIVDRIFTRIGASDNLAMGESTFMVEMKEVANIIDNATQNSLLILDEVGRGTSTFDGLSIANAIIEYIAEKIKAKTLFATHYHELVYLADKYPNITNLTIAVDRREEDIIFLRKIISGYSNNSYGIDVAKLAGIENSILKRSSEILKGLENDKVNIDDNLENTSYYNNTTIKDENIQKFIDKIKEIEVLNISPIEALNILNEIIEKSKEL